MKTEDIINLAVKYDKKAEKAYMMYQETGISRYDRERSNAEDMAEVLRTAAVANEDHTKLINLRGELVDLAYRIDRAIEEHGQDYDYSFYLTEVISLAQVFAGYRRIEKINK